jgi:hypothetical protein
MAAFVSQIAEATPGQMLALAVGVNRALRGETANIGRVTAASGSSSVTVQDPRCRAGRLAVLIPLDATAAGVTWWLDDMTQDSMTFGFGGALGADAEFGFAFLGDGNI